MASTPVEIQAPSGRTLTLELYPLGSDTIANTGGDSLTEHTNRKGFYQATVTESLSGWHHVLVKDGSTPILVGYIYLTDTTSVHRTEAPPWSQLDGRVTVEVDLVDAPNATAVAAIQDGLSTFDPTTQAVTVEAIEEDAIDAEAIAADAITAIQNGLATASALSTTDGKIDGIKAVTDALPDAGALTSLATATALQTVDDNVDAIKAVTDQLPDGGALTSLATAAALQAVDDNVDAIKAVTDNLPDSGALSSLATASALATVDNVVDAILEDTGTTLPSSLSTISGKVDTANSHLTDIKGGGFSGSTDSLEAIRDRGDAAWTTADVSGLAAKTDLPTNFSDLAITETTGRVTVGTNSDKTGYSLHSDYDAAKTAAQAGDEMALTSGALAAVNAAADQALSDYDPPTRAEATADKDEILGAVEAVDGVVDAILDAVETDGVALTNTTMQAIADALLDRANAIDGATPRAALRYIAAICAGIANRVENEEDGTAEETFLGLDGATPRAKVSLDAANNRTSVEYDPT